MVSRSGSIRAPRPQHSSPSFSPPHPHTHTCLLRQNCGGHISVLRMIIYVSAGSLWSVFGFNSVVHCSVLLRSRCKHRGSETVQDIVFKRFVLVENFIVADMLYVFCTLLFLPRDPVQIALRRRRGYAVIE